MQQLSPIREEALTLASELKERAAQAETEFADQWQRDLTSLEEELYASLCAYGETLERIPADESLSFVLKDSVTNRPAPAELTRCTSCFGQICPSVSKGRSIGLNCSQYL